MQTYAIKNIVYQNKWVLHNGSNSDYNLVIKELADEFEGQFTSLEENIKKYKTFSFPIEIQVIKIDKKGK